MIFSNKRRASTKATTTTISSLTEVPTSNRRHRRYLACMYNYLMSVKTAFQDYSTYKNGYDPYQMKQYADESKFDPYQNNQQVNQSDMEKILSLDYSSSSSSSSSSDDEDTLVHEEEQAVPQPPPTKRLRTMASNVVDHATQAVLYSTFAAFNFVWSEKKNLKEYYFQEKSNITDFSIPQPPQRKKQKVEFRGFGVDFCPLIERPAALQSRMENAERNIRDICLRTNESVHDAVLSKTVHSYGGNVIIPSKRTFDDTWGFVDNDLSVNFKPTMPPLKPQRRVFKQAIQLRRCL